MSIDGKRRSRLPPSHTVATFGVPIAYIKLIELMLAHSEGRLSIVKVLKKKKEAKRRKELKRKTREKESHYKRWIFGHNCSARDQCARPLLL